MKTFSDVFNETVQEFTGWQNAVAGNDMLKTAVDLLKKLGQLEPNSENLIVGGAVRDLLLGKEPHDIDIATSIDMNKIAQHFKTDEIGKSKDFGILNVHYGDNTFEVAHFRSDGEYTDSRRPDDVKLIKTFAGDAARRDYTINALGIDSKGFLHDYTGGVDDLNNKLIRAVGEPAKRLQEDTLRMLRAIRFAVKLGFKIEPNTENSIVELKDTIKKVAPDRIREELYKVAEISGAKLAEYFEYLDKVGLLQLILPEIKNLQGLPHNQKHHPEAPDVLGHVLATLRKSDSNNPVINLAIAFHDIAKAITHEKDEEGEATYHGHEGKSRAMIEEIAKRLHISNNDRDALIFAGEHHMHKFGTMKKSKVLAMRQNPNWDVLKKTMYADKSSRLHVYNKPALDKDMDYVEDIFKKFGETQAFEKKMSKFVDGRMIMSLVDNIKGADIGQIKDATREMIIAKDFNVESSEVRDFIIQKARELGYNI